ncbi:hypothetical protein Y1Q_0003920 [Alligator mississippiensis]|uniref:Uncharacterized protein n=1 Tax=Alligator mississippiensis TaxID=8496 RepID=A0A151MNS7_ALLMI|nr:hypothetical protein Y1Q_0003920 [Alligator mississippiensis]
MNNKSKNEVLQQEEGRTASCLLDQKIHFAVSWDELSTDLSPQPFSGSVLREWKWRSELSQLILRENGLAQDKCDICL